MGAPAPVRAISSAGWRTEDGEIRMLTMNRGRGTLLAALIALGAWTAAVLTPAVAEADLVATRWLQQFASPALDVAFSIFTIAGNAEVGAVLAGLIGVTLFRAGRARLAVALWAVFIGGTGIEWIAKHWLPHPGVPESLQRPGLNFLHYIVRTPYSYLSGHAFRTLLLAGVAWWMWTRSNRSQRLLRSMLGAAVALMGVALVYLGDHWASEVIGGYLLAVVGISILLAVPG